MQLFLDKRKTRNIRCTFQEKSVKWMWTTVKALSAKMVARVLTRFHRSRAVAL